MDEECGPVDPRLPDQKGHPSGTGELPLSCPPMPGAGQKDGWDH